MPPWLYKTRAAPLHVCATPSASRSLRTVTAVYTPPAVYVCNGSSLHGASSVSSQTFTRSSLLATGLRLEVVDQAIMAIIEAVPHISVQILVNGTPVPEFDDEDNNNGNNHDVANSVSSYVEVTAGESFSIQSHMKPAFVPKHDLVVRIHVDGKYVDSHVIRAVEIVRSGGHTSTSNGIRESTNAGQFLRRFIFSGITTSGSKYQPLKC